MNRRAEILGFNFQMLLALFILFIVCAVIVGIIVVNLNIEVDTRKSEADLFVERLLSPNGVGAVDDITRAPLLGVIDANRLKNVENSTGLRYGNMLGAKIEVGDKSYFVNKRMYDRIWPIIEAQHEYPLTQPLPKGGYEYRFSSRIKEGNTVQVKKVLIQVVVSDE